MSKWNKIKQKDLKSLGEAPVEASENIKAPELAPRDNRFTGRTKRIAFTCRPEFAEELRKMAFEKKCYQIEILERALEVYQKSLLMNKGESGEIYEKSQEQTENTGTKKWIIEWNNFRKSPCDDCENKEKQPTLCVWNEGEGNIRRQICRKHAENYRLVGQWSRVWRNFETKDERRATFKKE